MLSLEKRRYLFDVVFLYKVLYGYLNIELTPLLNFYSKADPYKFRDVDDYSLKRNYSRTTKFKNSYFNRIDHLTVVCLVAWPLYDSEAGVDIVMIETFLLIVC